MCVWKTSQLLHITPQPEPEPEPSYTAPAPMPDVVPTSPAGDSAPPPTRNLLRDGLPVRQDSDQEEEDQNWDGQFVFGTFFLLI